MNPNRAGYSQSYQPPGGHNTTKEVFSFALFGGCISMEKAIGYNARCWEPVND